MNESFVVSESKTSTSSYGTIKTVGTFCAVVISLASNGATVYPVLDNIHNEDTVCLSTSHINNTVNDVDTYVWFNNGISKEKYESLLRINEIRELQDDWNGNGARKFSDELIKRVEKIVMGILRQPLIFPTAQDSIQLEYEKDNGDYLEFEIFESKEVKEFKYYADGKTMTRYISDIGINTSVADFYE